MLHAWMPVNIYMASSYTENLQWSSWIGLKIQNFYEYQDTEADGNIQMVT